jgi:serine/threonine protein phosphatase PrpC
LPVGREEGEGRLKRTAARSDTGRVREGNEDRFIVREKDGTVLIAVADGVGGGPGGEIAADAAVEMLASRFFEKAAGLSVEDRLAEAIRDANTAVLEAAERSGKQEAASTLVAAAVRGDRAVIANLGDSRAYLVRAGAPHQLTEDHAASVAHGITRFVGDPRGVQPDVFVEDLRAGDRLVLCSDGLTRHVEPAEIAAHASGRDLDRAATSLVDLANARGGEDNVTLVVFAAEQRGGAASRRAFGLGVLAALVTFVAVGAVAALLVLAPYAPGASAPPNIDPTTSPSASAGSATPSPSPTPTESPTSTASPSAAP